MTEKTGLTRRRFAAGAGMFCATGALGAGAAGIGLNAARAAGSGVPFARNLAFRIAAENAGAADGAMLAALPVEGAGVTLRQADPAHRPRYVAASAYGGRPGIRFDGGQFLSCPVGAALNMVARQNYSVFVIYSDAAGAGDNPGRILSASAGNGFEIFAGADAVRAVSQSYRQSGMGAGWHSCGFTFQNPNSQMGNANGTGLYDCYVDGSAVWRQTASTAPSVVDDRLWFGALSEIPYHRYSGMVHEVLIWNRRLSQAEMIAVQKWACDTYRQPYPWAGEDVYTLFAGDSLTVGVGAQPQEGYPAVLMASHRVRRGAWSVLAVGGAAQDHMTSQDPGAVAAIRAVVGKPIVVLGHEWANQQTIANIQSKVMWYRALKAIGGVHVATGTSLGSNRDATASHLAARQAFDRAMAAHQGKLSDVYVPLHADRRIGDYEAWARNRQTYWTGDNLHLNARGYAVLADLFGKAHKQLSARASAAP